MIYWLAQTDSYIHINQHIGIPKWYFTLFTNIGTSLVKTQGCSCCLLSFCHPRRLLFTSWSCSLLVCAYVLRNYCLEVLYWSHTLFFTSLAWLLFHSIFNKHEPGPDQRTRSYTKNLNRLPWGSIDMTCWLDLASNIIIYDFDHTKTFLCNMSQNQTNLWDIWEPVSVFFFKDISLSSNPLHMHSLTSLFFLQ